MNTPDSAAIHSDDLKPDTNGETGADEDRAPIQAISRAMRILSLFNLQRPEMSLNEMTRLFGMGKATTHRYAMSLRHCGLLNYDVATGRYSLGTRLVGLARVAQAGLHVIEIAAPYLIEVADRLNEPIALSVWDGEAAVVMRVAEAPRRTIYRSMRIGSRLRVDGAHYTVFNAFLNADQNNLEYARIRQQKIAIRDGIDDDLRVIACPIFDGDEVVACIAASGNRRSIINDPDSPAAKVVQNAAARISSELGSPGRNRSKSEKD